MHIVEWFVVVFEAYDETLGTSEQHLIPRAPEEKSMIIPIWVTSPRLDFGEYALIVISLVHVDAIEFASDDKLGQVPKGIRLENEILVHSRIGDGFGGNQILKRNPIASLSYDGIV